MPRKQPTPESCVMKAVTDLLSAERVWCMRMNTRVVDVADGRAASGVRPMFFGRKGCADILATPNASVMRSPGSGPLMPRVGYERQAYEVTLPRLLWIECKAPGGKQSKAQIEFQGEVQAVGHFYLIAQSSDDVLDWLKKARSINGETEEAEL